jgi:flotillin
MFGYRVPNPDQAMLISGGRTHEGAAPFRVITGRGAYVMPFFRHVSFLELSLREAEVEEECVTVQGIVLKVVAVIAFKVGTDEESIVNAAQRFLSDQNQMEVLTGRIFAGHLRSIVGSLTVESIVTERQKLAEEVLGASTSEMAKLGLVVDALQIQSIEDPSGYITAMAAPHNAAIQQKAKVAQAEADRASAEAQQESERKQAEYARDTELQRAKYKAEVDREQATAAQAGPLAEAQAQQAVFTEQTKLAQRNAELKQQQLVAEIVKPAEAEAQRTMALAKAESDATELQAKAAASNDRVALDRMLIEQLPSIVEKAAGGLAHANVNVLNGADGLAELVAGLLAQGKRIYETARTPAGGNGVASDGMARAGSSSPDAGGAGNR